MSSLYGAMAIDTGALDAEQRTLERPPTRRSVNTPGLFAAGQFW
jgi:hypothetical protein